MNSITASEADRIALNGDTVGCMFVRCNSSSSPIKREVVTRIYWYIQGGTPNIARVRVIDNDGRLASKMQFVSLLQYFSFFLNLPSCDR